MNQDTIDLLDETVELTGIAEAWRDKAEEYRRRAVYAEGQWLALDEEVMRLRREVARLRKLVNADVIGRTERASERFYSEWLEQQAAARRWRELGYTERAEVCTVSAERHDRAYARTNRILCGQPAFGAGVEVHGG